MSILSIIVFVFSYSYADWQSQCIDTNEVGFIPRGMFALKFFYHSASLLGISRVTNSYFIVDLAIIVCLANFHVIAPLPSVNT